MSDAPFKTVVCDPPWPYSSPGELGKGDTPKARGSGSKARYGAVQMDTLKAMKPPYDEKGAHLYLWTTNRFLIEAHELCKAWGFRVVTMGTWVKTTEEPIQAYCPGCVELGCPICGDKLHGKKGYDHDWTGKVGLPHGVVRASARTGYYFKGATEHCLFAVAGKATPKWKEVIPTAWLWPRTPHSVKPPAFYDMVERVSPGPYLEMFARQNRLGWSTFGNQCLEHVQYHPSNEAANLPLTTDTKSGSMHVTPNGGFLFDDLSEQLPLPAVASTVGSEKEPSTSTT